MNTIRGKCHHQSHLTVNPANYSNNCPAKYVNWCNSGSAVMGITNHVLIGSKANSTIINSCLALLSVSFLFLFLKQSYFTYQSQFPLPPVFPLFPPSPHPIPIHSSKMVRPPMESQPSLSHYLRQDQKGKRYLERGIHYGDSEKSGTRKTPRNS